MPKNPFSVKTKTTALLSTLPLLPALQLTAWSFEVKLNWNGIALKLNEDKEPEEKTGPVLLVTAELDYPEALATHLHDNADPDGDEGSGMDVYVFFVSELERRGYAVKEIFTQDNEDFGTVAWGTGLGISIKDPTREKFLAFLNDLPSIVKEFNAAYM